MKWRPASLLTILALAIAVSACGTGIPTTDDRICDGIAAEVGGCDAQQPVFSGDTCDEVAREFGEQLDQRVLAVIDGPDVEDNESRSVRIAQAMSLMVSRMNAYLRDTGLIDECRDASAFVLAAERSFSQRLREEVGNTFYDGNPRVPYSDFREDLVRFLGVLEESE